MTERFIPTGYTLAHEASGLTIYHGTHPTNGRPVSLGFTGKRSKPAFHVFFQSAERQSEYEKGYIESATAEAARKEAYRKARLQPHTLKIGSILVSSWGYEQTNVDFYEVTELHGKSTVTIRQIAAQSTKETGWASDMVVAVPGKYIGEPERKRVSGENRIHIASYSSAGVWDGRALHRSWYA